MSVQQLSRVVLATVGDAVASLQISARARRSFPDVLADLKSAIEGAGLWLLHEIDPQALLRRDGLEIAAGRQILFFHPRLMKRILEADASAVLEAPLKIAILELGGGEMEARFIDPATSLARHGIPALEELGRQMRATCVSILSVVSREGEA
jgi:uncharacterized protein (DUF302 family)